MLIVAVVETHSQHLVVNARSYAVGFWQLDMWMGGDLRTGEDVEME